MATKIDRRGFLAGSASLALAGWRRVALAAGYPEYYAEHLCKVAARVNMLSATCADGFWFMTDLHIASNKRRSGTLIAELSKLTPLKRVLCGGDLVEAFGKKYPTDKAAVDFAMDAYRESWIKPIRAAGCSLYSAKGNHDFTVCHSAATPEERKRGFTYDGLTSRNFIVGEATEREAVTNPDDPTSCAYYFDNPVARVRYVVIDTTDTAIAGDVPWGVKGGVHATQLSWLAKTAIGGTPDGFGIVVMHHIPIAGVVATDGEVKLFAPVRRLLEAYQNRTRYVEGDIDIDYSAAGGRILLDLTGHHHCEMITYQCGVLHVTEPCDAAYRDYILRSKPWCGELPEKKGGTVAEQTFDAVQLDPARELVHFTRVGGGQNRSIHISPLTAKVGKPLRIEARLLRGALTWGCYDADKVDNVKVAKYARKPIYHNRLATISMQGVLTPRVSGEIVVIAMDENLNKEIFPVTIIPSKNEEWKLS